MSQDAAEQALPPVEERTLRAHRGEVHALAAQYGITDLRFASPGRLVGQVAADRDLFDVFAFQRAAEQLLGGEVELFSAAVVRTENASPDLAGAQVL
jgi:hypothetical protein